ncbi:MAG TPA: ATP-binding protein [bacterium]|nr:ATP-binding protein [bacterium]
MRVVRRRLGWKLFASYVLIVVVGSVVLWTTAQWVAPAAFTRHLAEMTRMVGQPPAMAVDVLGGFLSAMNTALAIAATAAFVTAVAVSLFVTRRIVAPVQSMMRATSRIADGRYVERVPVTSDDELGQLAMQFNRMAAALERMEQMRRDLIADVAHELRTPLASIAGYMEGLLDGVIRPEPEIFHRLHREAARLQRLVNDLQELSRAEAGQISMTPRRITVRELVEVAAGRLRSQFDDKGIALKVNIPRELPPVLADPDRMAQVVTNLLGNALQYTPPGGLVEVRARQEDGAVAVAVTDTGIGIAAEDLPHVFDRFYRVDRSRARASGGTGIGLTVARHLVEAHRGSITADSAGVGRGSTFTITLPTAP